VSAPLTDIVGIGPATSGLLIAAGFTTIDSIAHADPATLAQVSGIGMRRAELLSAAARKVPGEIPSAIPTAGHRTSSARPAPSPGPLDDDPAARGTEATPNDRPKAEATMKAKPKSKSKAKTKAKPKPKPKSKSKAKPKSKTKAKPKSKTKAKPKSKTKAKPKSKSKAKPKPETRR
jgi:outer membrane biosynthesis protein TonB